MTELRVLVCDDDPALLDIMLGRLDRMGIKPDRAEDGAAAQALIQESDYDLIVSDIYMPEATGLDLLQMAKDKNPQTQVIMVTASATLDNAIDALNHGAYGYLTKPFDHLSVFDNMVSRALEFRHLVLANERMAAAQKRRGDMLEDEVTARVRQLRLRQQGLIDLLNCLPDGILVVEEGGKLVMTSPKAEGWLARDRHTEDQPIQQFLSQVHSEWAEDTQHVQMEGEDLKLMAIDYPNPEGEKRKAVLIRPVEEEAIGQGSLVQDTVNDIKGGLAWLFQQDLGPTVRATITNLANQITVLEQLAGLASGAYGGQSKLAPAILPEYMQHEPALDPATGELIQAPSDNGRFEPAESAPEGEPGTQSPPQEEAWQAELAPETQAEPGDELRTAEAQPGPQAAAEEAAPDAGPEPQPQLARDEPPASLEDDLAQDHEEMVAPEVAVDLAARLGALDDTLIAERAAAAPPAQDALLAPETEAAPPPEPEEEKRSPQPAAQPEAQMPTVARDEKLAERAAGPVREPLWRRLAKRKARDPATGEPAPGPSVRAGREQPAQAVSPQAGESPEREAAPAPLPAVEPPLVEAVSPQAAAPEPAETTPASSSEPLSLDEAQDDRSGAWPPVLPSEDPEFSEELDLTG